MSRLSLSILVGSLLVGFVCDIRGQEKPTKSSLTNLAIETTDREPHRQFPVPFSEGGYTGISLPARRPDWKQAQDTAPLTQIRLRASAEQNGVRIKIGAVFDDSEPVDAPGPKYGEKEQIIASYLAQEGDTVTVSELERFGFEALVLKVVKYKLPLVAEPAPAILPEVVNELKSVSFVDLQSEGPSSHCYQLTLQNLVAKSIVGLTVRIPPSETQSTEGTRQNPLMTNGATFRTSMCVSEGEVRDNSRATLVIQTVLFDDGSYEGNVVAAAEIAARTSGRQIQLSRVLRLLQETPAQQDQEAILVIQDLKAGVTKFRIDVDASVVEQLQSQFPALPRENGRSWLAQRVMEGLKNGRGHALYRLNAIEQERTRNPKDFDLSRSMAALRERIAKLAGHQ